MGELSTWHAYIGEISPNTRRQAYRIPFGRGTSETRDELRFERLNTYLNVRMCMRMQMCMRMCKRTRVQRGELIGNLLACAKYTNLFFCFCAFENILFKFLCYFLLLAAISRGLVDYVWKRLIAYTRAFSLRFIASAFAAFAFSN